MGRNESGALHNRIIYSTRKHIRILTSITTVHDAQNLADDKYKVEKHKEPFRTINL